MAVAQPGRREASRRRASEGRGWVTLPGIAVARSDALDSGEREGGQQAPHFYSGRHPASLVPVHGGAPSDGHELLGVDMLGRDAEAFERREGGGQHRGWAAEKDIGTAQIWGEMAFE
jgi:hypothetical protein